MNLFWEKELINEMMVAKRKAVENITIRPLQPEDTHSFFQLIDNNRERLKRYFPRTVAEVSDLTACRQYVEKKLAQTEKKEHYLFLISKEEKMVGVLIVKNIDWRVPKCELAYFIDTAWEGKRVMSKAMDQLLAHCFDTLGMNKIFIRLSPHNEPSKRLAMRKGFLLEGTLRNEFRIETSELENIEYYGKLKGE